MVAAKNVESALAENNWQLPEKLTIAAGQEFTGLMLLQYPRLARFYEANAKHFKPVEINRDAVIYDGPDAIIP